jgi:hypothetical protein
MYIYFIGHPGSDAGGWYLGPDGKIHRIPGWNPEAMADFSHAINILREAGQLKTPNVAEAAIKSVMGFAQEQFSEHLKEGGVVVLGG